MPSNSFRINDYVFQNLAWDHKDGNELKRGYEDADYATPTFSYFRCSAVRLSTYIP